MAQVHGSVLMFSKLFNVMDKKKGEKQLMLDLDSSAFEAIIVLSSGKFNHLMSFFELHA